MYTYVKDISLPLPPLLDLAHFVVPIHAYVQISFSTHLYKIWLIK